MTSPGFAAGLSEHPDAAEAVGEAVGQVLEQLDSDELPDLAVLFVTAHHAAAMEPIAAAVRRNLRPNTLLGCTAETVVGGRREIEGGAGLSLWAGRTGPVLPFRMTAQRSPEGIEVSGWPDEIPADARAVLLMGDPFTFPADQVLGAVNQSHPELPVVGGMASAATGPGGNRVVLDDVVSPEGAVGAILGPGVVVQTVVSQGCRPVGTPFVVTRAEGNVVFELGGRTALERLGEVAETLNDDERDLLTRALHFGTVIDEHKDEFGRGDFLIRNVMGGDPSSGAIAVADVVQVGSTAQFQVRDAASADEDLRHLIDGHSPAGALLFTCNGRGTRLFPEPDHDSGIVSESTSNGAVAGMSCAGELGPVGGKNFLHGFTASILMLSSGSS